MKRLWREFENRVWRWWVERPVLRRCSYCGKLTWANGDKNYQTAVLCQDCMDDLGDSFDWDEIPF